MTTAWLVWDPDQDGGMPGDEFFDGGRVEAYDAEQAVEIWAADYDNEHLGPIAYGESIVVCVRPFDGGEIERWVARGKLEPVYWAERVEP